MTATPFVEGDLVEESDPLDARRLGSALGRLHESMRDLEQFDVPTVAALAPSAPSDGRAGWQVLHGDFSTANVIATADGLKIFDFDEQRVRAYRIRHSELALHGYVRHRGQQAARTL